MASSSDAENKPTSLYQLYSADELGADGYPAEWHSVLKHEVREKADNRCVRCGHPYQRGKHGRGEWTPCDQHCTHGAPLRKRQFKRDPWQIVEPTKAEPIGDIQLVRTAGQRVLGQELVEAKWRILTVHHLDGNKANCRWWNLVSLCQRCHLTIQGKVKMERVWPWEHTTWFKPYVAGYYAWTYLGEELDREATESRLDDLLALELAVEGGP